MHRKITKFKSQNLLGENRKQEKKRLNSAVIKAILSGKTRKQIRKMTILSGATKTQLAKRRKILNKAGLSKQRPLKINEVYIR